MHLGARLAVAGLALGALTACDAAAVVDVASPAPLGVESTQPATPEVTPTPAAPKVGDRIPFTAFPAPIPVARPALHVQEVQAAAVAKKRKKKPSFVSIPAMKVAVPIVVSRVKKNGHVAVPDADQVGWVNASKKPGAKRGVTLLAGHLTTGPKGADAGPLYGAEHLDEGARIKVVFRAKKTIFKVTGVTKHKRGNLPSSVLDPNGESRLALTTCTGPYVVGEDGKLWLSRNAIIWAERVK